LKIIEDDGKIVNGRNTGKVLNGMIKWERSMKG